MAAKIMDGLFIADAESSQDPEFLDLNKITYLINCAGKQVPNFYASHGWIYLKFDWDDNPEYAIFDSNGIVLRQLVEFIDQALANGASVLAFSLRGVSRCVACVSAYLMYKYRWGFEKTYSFVMSKRPDIEMNTGFCTQLQNLDRRLQTHRCKGDSTSMSDKDRRRLRDWDPGYLNDYPDSNSNPDDELLLVNSFLNSQQNFDVDMPPPRRMADKKQTAIKWSQIIETDFNEAELLTIPSKPQGTIRPILRTSIAWVSRHAVPVYDDSKVVQTVAPAESESASSKVTLSLEQQSISEALSANTKSRSSGLHEFVELRAQSQSHKHSVSSSDSLSQMLAELEASESSMGHRYTRSDTSVTSAWGESELKDPRIVAVNDAKPSLQSEEKEHFARRTSSTQPDPIIVDLGIGGSKESYEDDKSTQSTDSRRQLQPSVQDLASSDSRLPYSRPPPVETSNVETANTLDTKQPAKRSGAWVNDRRPELKSEVRVSRTGSVVKISSRTTDLDNTSRGSLEDDHSAPRRPRTSDGSDGPPTNPAADDRRTTSSSRRRAPSPSQTDRQTLKMDSNSGLKRAGGAPVYRHGSPAQSRAGTRKPSSRAPTSQVTRCDSTLSSLSASSDMPPASTNSTRIRQPIPQRDPSPSRTRTMGVQQPTAASSARAAMTQSQNSLQSTRTSSPSQPTASSSARVTLTQSQNSSQSGRTSSPSLSRRPSSPAPSPANPPDSRESIRSTARQRYSADMTNTVLADAGTIGNGRPLSASRARSSSTNTTQQRWR